MKLLLEITILSLLPLAALGTDSRLYRSDHHPYYPYQPPRPQYPSPQRDDYYPPLAQHPQPNYSCCRSSFPGKMRVTCFIIKRFIISNKVVKFATLTDEYGSCRVNTDCTNRVSPYCSAFGYCTQITQYGQGGCSPCEKIHHHQR